MSKEYCYSNWRDEFNPTEYEFVDLIKPDPIKTLDEGKKKGLWDRIHAKRKRGERPAKPGEKGYPETLDIEEGLKKARKNVGASKCWDGYKAKGTKMKDGKEVPNCVKEETLHEDEYRRELARERRAEKEAETNYRSKGRKVPEKKKGPKLSTTKKSTTAGKDYADSQMGSIRHYDKLTKKNKNVVGLVTKEEKHTPTKSDLESNIGGGNLKKLAAKATKRIDYDVDGDIDPQDKVEKSKGEYGEELPTPFGKFRTGAAKPAKVKKEEFSNWREDLEEDWQKVNKGDKTDGMSQKAVDTYRRENPGSKLKTAVTGDPKPGSKDAKRRKSFCSRSKGQQDMHNIDCSKDPDKAICKARRRWKC